MTFIIKGLIVLGVIGGLIFYFKWRSMRAARRALLVEIQNLEADLGEAAEKAIELANERLQKVKVTRLAELYLTERSTFDKRKKAR